jgi:hypothetical protein
MSELGDSLERMSFMQLALLFGFVTSYVLTIGGLFGPTVRLRAGVLALVLAVAFAALTDPWVHGALLVVFVVAGLGLFVLLSWLLARLFGPKPLPAALPQEAPIDDTADASPLSQPQPLNEGAAAVPKLARRARAAR